MREKHYSATQNNGKITSETDIVSGEQVAYTYDSLNRLATATSSVNPCWGQSYTYDGFGNLTQQTVTKGTAPSLSVSYDPATNRQTGECADANGNLCGNSYSYDVENRLVAVGSLARFSYAPGNKRVWRGVWSGSTQTTDEVTYWSVTGQKLVTYQVTIAGSSLVASATGTNEYFGGKLIKNATGFVTPDHLGSIGKYFPYGQERPSATTNGTEKFATYFRDSETGLDYAKNRYHQPGMGRFMTPDPYSGSARANDPESWNRYPYSGGDPVNNSDPSGLDACTDFLILEENPEAGMSICGGAIFDLDNEPGGGGSTGDGGSSDSGAADDGGDSNTSGDGPIIVPGDGLTVTASAGQTDPVFSNLPITIIGGSTSGTEGNPGASTPTVPPPPPPAPPTSQQQRPSKQKPAWGECVTSPHEMVITLYPKPPTKPVDPLAGNRNQLPYIPRNQPGQIAVPATQEGPSPVIVAIIQGFSILNNLWWDCGVAYK